MTRLLWTDPGENTGIALGYYDATTPYRLLERWQVHGGVEGYADWWEEVLPTLGVDEMGVEKFVLAANDFRADLTPVEIEGAIKVLRRVYMPPNVRHIMWQDRTAKGSLTGYPPEAREKWQRQRVRFDFLDRFGLFKEGTENDDSNDAITHSLVNLKKRRHMPTSLAFWPPREFPAAA